MMAANRKCANIMMEKLPSILTYDDGMGKLFKTHSPKRLTIQLGIPI